MNKNYNSITLARETFEKYSDDIQVQRQMLWDTAYRLMNILISLEYICVIYEDEIDILVIEFEHNERFTSFGSPNPVWMTEEEKEDFYYDKQERESLSQEIEDEK